MRPIFTVTLLFVGACSGSFNCSGCLGGPLDPIPGGFDPAAQIERAAQIRVSQAGLDLIGSEFQNLMSAYARMSCGQPTDVPCPGNFVTPAGAPNPASCVAGVCTEQVSGAPGPLIGFEIPQTVSGNATVCRDDPNQPGARRCFAWLRFEAMQIQPVAPDRLIANITVQIETNDIPFRYNALGGMDCIMSLSSVPNTQDLDVTVALSRYNPPVGNGGQLQVEVLDVTAMIPDNYVNVASDPDPRFNDGALLCAIADLGFIKQILIGQLTDELASIVGDEVDKALGMACFNNTDCPAQTSCNSDDVCEENVSGVIVPSRLGLEGRLDFSQLLAGFVSGRPGRGDISFMIGGDSTADTGGANIGALGGAEVVNPDPSCAMLLESPRLRPGFRPPAPLSTSNLADLDWDGTEETSYMLAAGLSQALMDQFMWTVYTTGLFCTGISSFDIGLLNTGSLGLLIGSLEQLTHHDKFPEAIFPARLTIFPGAEPKLRIGSGEVSGTATSPMLDEPLLTLDFDDFEVTFHALIEDRWVRLMTVSMDLDIQFGAMVNANNEIQLLIGDLSNAVSNVQVTNSELLGEDPAELEMAIPGLINLALPGFTGALPPFALPAAADLGGFELDVLGIRGVDVNGVYENVAVYADLGFDPTQVGNLRAAAETTAEIEVIEMPSAEAFAVSNPNGPQVPKVLLRLGGSVPGDGVLEHQIRVDDGLWSPFFVNDTVTLTRPEFLVQGRHVIEVRARERGAYRTLDASPERIELIIDPAPPHLTARLDNVRKGLIIHAYDVVSEDRVRVLIGAGEQWREVALAEDGFVAVDEVAEGDAIAVRAIDEQGNVAERILRREGAAEVLLPAPVISESVGCACVTSRARASALLLLALLPLVVRRRR